VLEAPLTVRTQPWGDLIYKHGILALVYVIDRLEKDEFYEECGSIISAIKEDSELIGYELPTRVDRAVILTIAEEIEDQLGYRHANETWVRETYQAYANSILIEMGYK
jgi:hypothetical protein